MSSPTGYELQLNEPFVICYAWNFDTSELVYHGKGNRALKEVLLHGPEEHMQLSTDDKPLPYYTSWPGEDEIEIESPPEIQSGGVEKPAEEKVRNKWWS